MSYTIIFNNKNSEDLGVYVIKRPFIPIPKRKYETIEIEGSDGDYYSDDEYEDIDITIEFNFESTQENIRPKIREITKWIEKDIDNKLVFSDDTTVFFKVSRVEFDNFNYEEIYEIQKFNVTFTCKPYQYILSGQKEFKVNGLIFNYWNTCRPIYRIVGNGNCVLSINGINFNCNVDNGLIIDTEHNKIFDGNKNLVTGKTNIKYIQDLYLKNGKNNITISAGFSLYIKTNYRTI